jgi:topoisomerase-4 subunit B
MGKNTPERQQHIIRNLRIEKDEIKEDAAEAETNQAKQDLEVA